MHIASHLTSASFLACWRSTITDEALTAFARMCRNCFVTWITNQNASASWVVQPRVTCDQHAARMERTCTKMCAQVLLHYNQASVAIPKDDGTETRHTKKFNALGRISLPTLFAHVTGISACRRRFWVHVCCKTRIYHISMLVYIPFSASS